VISMTMVDNFEFPWQPDSPIPWRDQSYDFVDFRPDRWFIATDVTHFELGPDNPMTWKVYASVYLYQTGRAHRHQSWHPTADEAKAAAEAHIREHAS
jgi:hypothetical protein